MTSPLELITAAIAAWLVIGGAGIVQPRNLRVVRLLFIVGVGAMIIDGSVPLLFAWLVVIREAALAVVLVVMTMLGMQRFDVTYWGKAATFLLMFAFPAFLLGASDFPGNDLFQLAGWLLGIPGLVLSYYSAITYIPMIRDNLREGRAKRALERAGR